MANLLKTERDFDLALLELQLAMEEEFQKGELEFRGPRLAHRQALPEPQAQPMQPPAPMPAQGGY